MRRTITGVTAVLCAVIVGCGPGERRGTLDSAGQVDAIPLDAPLFSISEGTSPVPWALNLAEAGTILQNGASVVVNYNESLALVLDTAGDLLYRTGRRGQGPGEFNGGVGKVFSVGAGFGAWDLSSRRFSFFDSNGQFTHAFSLSDWRFAQPIAWMHGHGLFVTEYGFEPGQQREFVLVDTMGAFRFRIYGPSAPPHFFIRYRDERGRFSSIMTGFDCTPSLFPAAIADAFYVAHSGTGTIYRYGLDGTSGTIYQETNRQTVTNDVLRLVQARYSMAPSDSFLSYLRAIGSPGDPLPTWSEVLTDDLLGLFLLLETRCGSSLQDASTWAVISNAGEFLGRVLVPPASKVLAARGGRVLLVRRDDLGVEFAELYALPREVVSTRN